jgi:hypothetical protein
MLILALRQPALLATPAREAFLGRVALSALMGLADGPQFRIGPLLKPSIFSPSDLAFRLSAWLETGAAAVAPTIASIHTPVLIVAGQRDRLLPSVKEAERLSAIMPASVNRGTVVVPCAGHASTLGTQIDLVAEILAAFAPELGLQTAKVESMPTAGARPPIGAPNQPSGIGAAWANGIIPRTYDSLPVMEYREWNRGGKRCPVPTPDDQLSIGKGEGGGGGALARPPCLASAVSEGSKLGRDPTELTTGSKRLHAQRIVDGNVFPNMSG